MATIDRVPCPSRPSDPLLLAAFVLVLALTGFDPPLRGDATFSLEKPAMPPHAAHFHITKMVDGPVLTRSGQAGDWDSIDLLNPSVVKTGGIYYSYYSGYNGKVWQTGLATSGDGLTWSKFEKNPVVRPGQSEFALKDIAANGDAILINERIHYYYQGKDSAGVVTIGQAISADGKAFPMFSSKPVIDIGMKGSWDDTAVGDPNIVSHGDGYYLYYLGMNSVGVQRLGVAHSTDGAVWEKYAGNPILDAGAAGCFDENGVGEPAVVFSAPFFYMLYTGRDAREQRNLGLAVSRDGVNWRKICTNGLVPPEMQQPWDNKVVCDPSIVRDGHGGLMVYFGGGDSPGPAQNLHGNIGLFYATAGTSRRVFDASADWSAESSNEVLFGSYPVEASDSGKFVWVGPDAEITLTKGPTGKLKIAGWVPLSLYHDRNGADSFSVDISAGGREVGEINVAAGKDGVIAASFDLSGVPADDSGNVTIKLHSSRVLTPTDRDRRKVSFIVNRIELE